MLIKPKNRIWLITLLLIGGVRMAQAQENHVFKGSFEDCKKQAAEENKMILVDLYFEGCMPCKEMDDKVFPDPEVVKILKPDFLLYKTDVFKEEDGMKISRKYAASGFPTYMVMDPSGKTILIESGFFGVSRFIPLLQKAKSMRDAGQFLAFDNDTDKEYPTFYNYRYLRKGEKGDASDLSTFLAGKDLQEEVPFVVSTLVNAPEINAWTYSHLPILLDKYGSSLLRNKVTRLAEQKIQIFGQTKQLDSLYKTLDYIRPVFNDRLWSVFLPSFVTAYYKGSQDADTYLALIDKYKLYPTWAQRSNALGQVIIDQKGNKSLLEKLRNEYLGAEREGSLDFTDTYKLTLLHFYVGDYQKASTGVDILLKSDLSNPYYKVKKADLESLQTAIAKKEPKLFEAKNMEKVIPFRLDD